MKYKKLTLVCTATLISVSTLFVSCGSEGNTSKDIESNVDVISEEVDKGSNTKDTSIVSINEESNIDEKVDFSKYSDEYLVNFLNEGTEALTEKMQSTGSPDHYYDKDANYIELSRPFETIEKRQAIINKYYAPGVYEEEYVSNNGKTYLRQAYYINHIPYIFHGVKSREVIGNNTLKVSFNVTFKNGYPVVNKDVKTVEFTEINGELKATSLFEEGSMLNAIENKDESQPCLDDKQRELFEYVTTELEGVLREDQLVNGISERYYDAKTDSTYYGLAVKEPTQNAICYFVNMKNGAIYGHYEGRFVVAPKKEFNYMVK